MMSLRDFFNFINLTKMNDNVKQIATPRNINSEWRGTFDTLYPIIPMIAIANENRVGIYK